jgi:hypothetical protein
MKAGEFDRRSAAVCVCVPCRVAEAIKDDERRGETTEKERREALQVRAHGGTAVHAVAQEVGGAANWIAGDIIPRAAQCCARKSSAGRRDRKANAGKYLDK